MLGTEDSLKDVAHPDTIYAVSDLGHSIYHDRGLIAFFPLE